MYNRYIPDGAQYVPTGSQAPPPGVHQSAGPSSSRSKPGGLSALLSGLFQGERGQSSGNSVSQAVSSVLKSFHLEHLDTGDILLALIVLFLILEDGDDLDLIITLGLMILFSLGEP